MIKVAIRGIADRLDTTSYPAYASMRVAGQATPCYVYECNFTRTMRMPSTGGIKAHYLITVDVDCIADTLDTCFDMVEMLVTNFDGGPFTFSASGKVVQLTVTDIGPFQTRAEIPDDGQQDAERVISAQIQLQATEL
jgi:hypothetical protein